MTAIIRMILLSIACMSCSAPAMAQIEQVGTLEREYGSLQDVIGVGKIRVFVHTENLESRGKILKELAKYPMVEVVGRVADSVCVLIYGSGSPVSTTATVLDNFTDDGVYTTAFGEMVAIKIVNNSDGRDGRPRTLRVMWHTRKRQTLLRTNQFFSPTQFGATATKSSWISLLLGGILSSFPRLASLPVNRSPEVNATRDFIKALKKAREQQIKFESIPQLSPPIGKQPSASQRLSRVAKQTEGQPELPHLFAPQEFHSIEFVATDKSGRRVTFPLSTVINNSQRKYRKGRNVRRATRNPRYRTRAVKTQMPNHHS
jgi:hypothetical protein